MRYRLIGCLLLLSCAKEQPPAQDPLDYLRVGVDPNAEANAIIDELRRNGFEVGRRIQVGGLATGRLEKDRSDATVWTDVASMEAHAEPSAPLQADGEPYGTVAQVTVEAGNHRLMVVGP